MRMCRLCSAALQSTRTAIEDLAKAIMGQVGPLHADLSEIAWGVQR